MLNQNSNEDDDGFDVKAIIDGTSMICINGFNYPVCTNGNMKDHLKAEEGCSDKPVTALLREKWHYMQNHGVSKRVANIFFIYRDELDKKDGFAIDIRPTAHLRK